MLLVNTVHVLYIRKMKSLANKINVLANICVLNERAELIEILVFQHSD